MGLKEVKVDKRVIFLRMFVEELLYNSLEKERIKQKIEAEKIKQRFLEPKKDHEEVFKSFIRGLPIKSEEKKELAELPKFKNEQETNIEQSTSIEEPQEKRISSLPKYRFKLKSEPVFIKGNLISEPLKQIPPASEKKEVIQQPIPQRSIQPRVQQQVKKETKQPVQIIKKPAPIVKEEIRPSILSTRDRDFDNMPLRPSIKPPTKTGEAESVKRVKELMIRPRDTPAAQSGDYGYRKIENLLRDPSIVSIECSGPGKPLLVRRQNKIQKTNISLNQAEIMEVIDTYSRQARIPLVGGILKAAVGNSIISAVNSEFVGARFIINKITPYSILDRN